MRGLKKMSVFHAANMLKKREIESHRSNSSNGGMPPPSPNSSAFGQKKSILWSPSNKGPKKRSFTKKSDS